MTPDDITDAISPACRAAGCPVPAGTQHSWEDVLRLLWALSAAVRREMHPARPRGRPPSPHRDAVLELVAAGLTDAQIAVELGVSEQSARGIRRRAR